MLLNNRFYQLILFFITSTIGCAVLAAPPIVFINTDAPSLNLSHSLEYLEDTEAGLSWQEIESGLYTDHFKSSQGAIFQGDLDHRYWFKLRLQLDETEKRDQEQMVLFLNTLQASLYKIDIKTSINGTTGQLTKTGNLRPYYNRDLNSLHLAFNITLNKDRPTEIIGYVDNTDNGVSAILPFNLLSQDEFKEFDQSTNAFLIAFYAIMASLLIYNLILFLSLRQSPYGFYLLFLISAAINCAGEDGTIIKWFFPESPEWSVRMQMIFGIFTPWFYSAFIYSALADTSALKSNLKFYKLVAIIGGGLVIHNSLSANLQYCGLATQLFSAFVLTGNSYVLINAVLTRAHNARYLLIAESVTIAGASVFILMIQGVIPINPFSFWSLHWGFLGEALLLSLALAARTRHAQQTALRNLEKYETLYEDSIEGRFQYSFKDQNLRCNMAQAKICGYETPNRFIKLEDVTRFTSEETNLRLFQTLLEKDKVIDYEASIIPFNTEQPTSISLSIKLIRDPHGKPERVEGTAIDITERKLKEVAEEERRVAEAENRAKSDFLSKMSHEIRTPMTGIIGMSDLLAEKLEDHTNIRYNKVISNSASSLLSIINDLLDYSKIEADKMELESIPFDLEGTAVEAMELFRVLAREKGIQLILSVSPNLPNQFVGDPVRIRQVIINYLSNALKFTDSGNIVLSITQDKGRIKIAVKDNGIGIAKENQAALFQPFSQADKDTHRNFGGTGLGLAICKQIAELMGGEVGVESQLNEGAVFWMAADLKIPLGSEAIIPQALRLASHTKIAVTLGLNKPLVEAMEPLFGALGIKLVSPSHPDIHTIKNKYDAKLLLVSENWINSNASQWDGLILNVLNLPIFVLSDGLVSHNINAMQTVFNIYTPAHSKNIMDSLCDAGLLKRTRRKATRSKKLTKEISGTPLNILVAEDNSVNRLVIDAYLRKAGCQHKFVYDGQAALETYKDTNNVAGGFDLILMDCDMPILDGVEATKRIRSWEQAHNLKPCPIYALTAHAQKEEIDRCIEAGMNGHLSKPIDKNKLLSTLQRYSSPSENKLDNSTLDDTKLIEIA